MQRAFSLAKRLGSYFPLSHLAVPVLRSSRLAFLALSFILAAVVALSSASLPVQAVSTTVVISQFQVAGASAADEFIEIHNRSSSPVDLNGYNLVYRSASGTSDVLLVSWSASTVISAGGYYLVGATPGYDPANHGNVAPDTTYADGDTGRLAGDGGGLALRNGAPNTGTRIDSVGYGTATNAFIEGTSTTAPAANAGMRRQNSGCQDSDDNSSDFTLVNPSAPRNSSTSAFICPTPPSGVGTATPSGLPAGNSTLLTVAATPGANPVSTGMGVTCSLTAIGGGASQAFYDDGTNGDATNGDSTFSYIAMVNASTPTGAKSLPCTITDAQGRTGPATIKLVVAPLVNIHDVQGAGQLSPKSYQLVTLKSAIVTAVRTSGSKGFWLESPEADWDADDATSEGIFVYTGSTPTVSAGDAITVAGTVNEYRPGGSSSANLTVTEITWPTITKVSSGNTLPPAVVVGTGGRIPPTKIIENDATGGNVETGNVFDPAEDGVDFWESLEGMYIRLNDAVAVGPTNIYGETPIVGDNGANASLRTPRGGLVIQADDYNPERVVLDDSLLPSPQLNVGDHFTTPVVGVLDYNFGNYMLEFTEPLTRVTDGVAPQTGPVAGNNQIAIATFNVENLAPSDPASKFSSLAGLIVNNLKAPDILAVEEIQDNNGRTDDGTVDAATTYDKLITAIQTAGGPAYQYRQVNPVDNQDGGAPGGNIRQGFLFSTDRGVSFVDRSCGSCNLSTMAVQAVKDASGVHLSFSPGRIDPQNAAFVDSRKPLVGEFLFHGRHLFVIANHWNSKGGDQPLVGRYQPPALSSATQRLQQAQVVHDFVNSILGYDPNADVVVMGDLNDFQFSAPLQTLKGTPQILNALIDTLPPAERYTYVYEGNSETLDHILLSNDPFNAWTRTYQVVHVNSEFANQSSDHDPQVGVFTVPYAVPTLTTVGPSSGKAGGAAFTLTVTGTNFAYGSTVRWNGSNRATSYVSDTQLTASIPASDIAGVGTASITVFNPTPGGGLSNAVSFPIAQANTSLVLASSKTPSVVGETVTFSATLTQSAGMAAPRQPKDVTPTGVVTFTIDSRTNVTRTMSANGVVTFSTSALAVGSHTITAQYGGDANLVPAASVPLTQVVNASKLFLPVLTR